jgi:hypothetical protein
MRGFRSISLAVLIGLGAAVCAIPLLASAQMFVSVRVGFPPPPLPIYVQPPIPAYGYIWTPGYWAWNGYDYYWVPGTWVEPPEYGLLWTPAWWGWDDGFYGFHDGYWGPEVGYYGGIFYGFGYTGYGYDGGYWRGGNLYYNRWANNFGAAHIANVYNRPLNRASGSNVSYNGGPGGSALRPTAQQLALARASHVAPTTTQRRHVQLASANHSLLASVNHGRPSVAATSRANVLHGRGTVGAQNAATWRGTPTAGSAAASAAAAAGGQNRAPAHQSGTAPQPGHPNPGSAMRPVHNSAYQGGSRGGSNLQSRYARGGVSAGPSGGRHFAPQSFSRSVPAGRRQGATGYAPQMRAAQMARGPASGGGGGRSAVALRGPQGGHAAPARGPQGGGGPKREGR